jgi:hypothetical protein
VMVRTSAGLKPRGAEEIDDPAKGIEFAGVIKEEFSCTDCCLFYQEFC